MSKSSKDPNKKHYFNSLSREEVNREGEEFATRQAEFHLWTEGQSEDDVEIFQCLEFNQLAVMFTLEYKPTGLLSKLSKSKLVNQDVYVKVESHKSHIFTTSHLKYSEEKKNYNITINNPVFRSLQRQNYRLNAGLKNAIQIKLGEGLIFDGLDISAGGMSFLIENDQVDLYKKGMTFNYCTARLNRDRFEIEEVTIAGLWPQEEPGTNEVRNHKVGVSFSKIDADTEEKLFKIINSMARVEEMTKSLVAKKLKKS